VFQPYASVATNLLFFTKGKPTKEIWYWEHQLPSGVKAYSKTKPINKNEFQSLKQWWHKREENEQAWRVSIEDLEKNGFNIDVKNSHISEVERGYSSVELLEMLHDSFRKSDELLDILRKEFEYD
jgi:type I restriction enzyme M protein